MKKVKIIANDNFQKSIESTVKVLADNKNLNILFGDSNNKNKTDIILPILKTSSQISDVKKIRGISDSESLIKKYHDTDLHRELSPVKEDQKKIFDTLENMRCEVLGSFNMPGVKKNISDLFELEISNKKKKR